MRIVARSYSETRDRNAQDKVLSGYQNRFNLSPQQASQLHLFFSPTRVPKGLTRKEVEVVLALYSLRDKNRKEKQRRLASQSSTGLANFHQVIDETALPEELQPVGRITRGNFLKGVAKLLEEILKG